MSQRKPYRDHWYEASATFDEHDASQWDGEVKIGKTEPDGSEVVLLNGFIVSGPFRTILLAIDAADRSARDYIDKL